jgi:hypothetical protein
LLAGYYEKNRLILAGKIRSGFEALGTKERLFARFRGLGSDTYPFDIRQNRQTRVAGWRLPAEAMKLCC